MPCLFRIKINRLVILSAYESRAFTESGAPLTATQHHQVTLTWCSTALLIAGLEGANWMEPRECPVCMFSASVGGLPVPWCPMLLKIKHQNNNFPAVKNVQMSF